MLHMNASHTRLDVGYYLLSPCCATPSPKLLGWSCLPLIFLPTVLFATQPKILQECPLPRVCFTTNIFATNSEIICWSKIFLSFPIFLATIYRSEIFYHPLKFSLSPNFFQPQKFLLHLQKILFHSRPSKTVCHPQYHK